jgi:hypothetical protein
MNFLMGGMFSWTSSSSLDKWEGHHIFLVALSLRVLPKVSSKTFLPLDQLHFNIATFIFLVKGFICFENC